MAEQKAIAINDPVRVINPFVDYSGMTGTVIGIEANTIIVRIDIARSWMSYNVADLELVQDAHLDYGDSWKKLKALIYERYEDAEQCLNNAEKGTPYFYSSLSRSATLQGIIQEMEKVA